MTFLILDGRDNVLILILMETLLHQEKKFLSILVKQRQNLV